MGLFNLNLGYCYTAVQFELELLLQGCLRYCYRAVQFKFEILS